MPVNPASPIPNNIRSIMRPANEVTIDWREATMPQDRTIAVTIFENISCGLDGLKATNHKYELVQSSTKRSSIRMQCMLDKKP